MQTPGSPETSPTGPAPVAPRQTLAMRMAERSRLRAERARPPGAGPHRARCRAGPEPAPEPARQPAAAPPAPPAAVPFIGSERDAAAALEEFLRSLNRGLDGASAARPRRGAGAGAGGGAAVPAAGSARGRRDPWRRLGPRAPRRRRPRPRLGAPPRRHPGSRQPRRPRARGARRPARPPRPAGPGPGLGRGRPRRRLSPRRNAAASASSPAPTGQGVEAVLERLSRRLKSGKPLSSHFPAGFQPGISQPFQRDRSEIEDGAGLVRNPGLLPILRRPCCGRARRWLPRRPRRSGPCRLRAPGRRCSSCGWCRWSGRP